MIFLIVPQWQNVIEVRTHRFVTQDSEDLFATGSDKGPETRWYLRGVSSAQFYYHCDITEDVRQIIEEDLIFPCPDSPGSRTPKASPALRGRVSRSLSRSTGTSMVPDDDLDDFTLDRELNPSGSKARSLDTVSEKRQDQRDHSKLKEAYLQMLSARFINPQVLSVLGFYLQASFADVQKLPVVRLYVPPPSGVPYNPPVSDDASYISFESSMTLVDSASSSPTYVRRLSDASDVPSPGPPSGELQRSRFYLAKVLGIIRGCKEAIWLEYEKLHWQERSVPNESLDRDDFEMLFYNWEWCVCFLY